MAFRYVPFQTMSRCLSCRGKADDDDFGSMKFPATNAAFTPDDERIHSSTSSRCALPQHRPRVLALHPHRDAPLRDLHRDIQAVRRSGFVCEFFVVSGGWFFVLAFYCYSLFCFCFCLALFCALLWEGEGMFLPRELADARRSVLLLILLLPLLLLPFHSLSIR
jgi:hypothetical protein